MICLLKHPRSYASLSRTRTYLEIDLGAAILVALTYATSSVFPLNPGVSIAALEVLTSSIACLYLVLKPAALRDTTAKLLLGLFAFLLIGDLMYGYFYYWREVGVPTRARVFMHEIPLSLSYFLLPLVYLHSMRRSLKDVLRHPFSIVPVLVALPLMTRFLFPLNNPIASNMDAAVRAVEAFSLACTFVGLVLSMWVFVFAKAFFWSIFSLGMTTAYLAGLGIRIERLTGMLVGFNAFECLWAYGNLIAVLALILLFEHRNEATFKKERSIVFSTRMVGLVVAFAGSVFLSILRWRELEAVATIICTSILSLHIAGVLGHYLWDQLMEYSSAVDKLLAADLADKRSLGGTVPRSVPVEMSEIYASTLRVRIQDFKRESDLQKEMEIANQNERRAKQVAHDLRSPLTALQICATHIPMSKEYRSILSKSVERLKGIANDLWSGNQTGSAQNLSKRALHSLTDLIEDVVSEKRMQYCGRTNVEIKLSYSGQESEYRALINPIELKRVISNLVDNSLESLTGAGEVEIFVAKTGECIQITVTDTGHGIPAEILPRLGERGASFGKEQGHGLGLYHAKSILESWGGRFSIHSDLGQGTRVLLTIAAEANFS